jgi:hypothetical protein
MDTRNQPCQREGRAWLRRLACERAVALPAAAMMLMIIFLLAAAAATAAISASGQSNHDRGTKQAVAAADAGLDTALYRLNKLQPAPLSCVVSGPLQLLLNPILGTGWCPTVTVPVSGGSAGGEQLADNASFTYTMSAGTNVTVLGQGQQHRKIIVTGTANGVSRRIMADVSTMTGVSAFGGNALTSLEDISLPIGTAIIGGVASNGNVAVGLCPQIAGNSWYGPGKAFIRGGTSYSYGTNPCPLFRQNPLPQNVILNPVDASKQNPNDNARINQALGDLWTLRLLSGSTWDEGTRVLHLKGAATLTLRGSKYSFCKIIVEDSAQLIIAPRLATQQPLKMYLDRPENCPAGAPSPMSDAGTMKIKETGSITNLNADSDTLQISAVGSTTYDTSIRFENAVSNLIGTIYAPSSTVALENANAILGAVAAKRVTLEDTSRIQWHPSADITLDDLFPLFKRTKWMECTVKPTGPAPDSGCS